MKTLKVLALCGAAFLLVAVQSPAEELLLTVGAGDFVPNVDVSATDVNYDYTPGTPGTFSVTPSGPGYTGAYIDASGVSHALIDDFNITAYINSSWTFLSSGSLSVSGDFYTGTDKIYSGTLLTANLNTGMPGDPPGSALVGAPWDYYIDTVDSISEVAFSFTVTGGYLAGGFGGEGGQGVIELGDPYDAWDFTQSFSRSGLNCDIIPIPEPSSTLLLLVSGAMGWTARRSCRKAGSA